MEAFCIAVKPIKVSVFVSCISLQCGVAYLDIDLITAAHNITDSSFEIGSPDFIAMRRIHRNDTQAKHITIDIKNFVLASVQKLRMVARWDRNRIG